MTRHKKQDSAELLFLIVVAIAAMLFCFAVGLSVEKHYGTRKVAANSAQVSKDSDRVKKENKELRMTVRDQQRILDQYQALLEVYRLAVSSQPVVVPDLPPIPEPPRFAIPVKSAP